MIQLFQVGDKFDCTTYKEHWEIRDIGPEGIVVLHITRPLQGSNARMTSDIDHLRNSLDNGTICRARSMGEYGRIEANQPEVGPEPEPESPVLAVGQKYLNTLYGCIYTITDLYEGTIKYSFTELGKTSPYYVMAVEDFARCISEGKLVLQANMGGYTLSPIVANEWEWNPMGGYRHVSDSAPPPRRRKCDWDKHDFINTGMRRTWCRVCDAEGLWDMGIATPVEEKPQTRVDNDGDGD